MRGTPISLPSKHVANEQSGPRVHTDILASESQPYPLPGSSRNSKYRAGGDQQGRQSWAQAGFSGPLAASLHCQALQDQVESLTAHHRVSLLLTSSLLPSPRKEKHSLMPLVGPQAQCVLNPLIGTLHQGVQWFYLASRVITGLCTCTAAPF